MSLRAERTATLLVPLDLDGGTLEGFYAELHDQLSRMPVEVLLDCSLLDHASSTHINTIWQARNRCEEAGVAFKLTSVTYGLERVLKILDLYDFFSTERDGVEARAGKHVAETDGTSPQMLALEVEPTVEGIRKAMATLHEYLMRLDLGEVLAFDLETVFYEVTTNIRLHGKMDRGEFIMFRAVPRNEVFRLRFEDTGPYFDPTSRADEFDPRKAMRNRQRQGFGLAMIKKLVDSISYERANGRFNILDLEKQIGGNGGHYS